MSKTATTIGIKHSSDPTVQRTLASEKVSLLQEQLDKAKAWGGKAKAKAKNQQHCKRCQPLDWNDQ